MSIYNIIYIAILLSVIEWRVNTAKSDAISYFNSPVGVTKIRVDALEYRVTELEKTMRKTKPH